MIRLLVLALLALGCERADVRIGSKNFTESVILGEALAHLARAEGAEVTHKANLGGTPVLWKALLGGDIDAYVDYTGTLRRETLRDQDVRSDEALRAALADHGVGMSRPLGFNNTYALGVRRQVAERLGLVRITDLRDHPHLRLRFSEEFTLRGDGWPGLKRRYALPQTNVKGIDHDVAYRGLAAGDADVMDVYSTDASITHYDLAVLEDDLGYFPRYDAVILWRLDLAERAPGAVRAFRRLEGSLDDDAMRALNGHAKLDQVPESAVAADFISAALGVEATVQARGLAERLWQRTREHLVLVGISLSLAIGVAIPLGIWAARRRRVARVLLPLVGIVQTIPSLALLVFMIPLLGLEEPPAIVALFLYSLLPIVRNTYTGLHDIPPALLESADALGLPRRARLRLVELPLAARAILGGIKTSAVINVGTATLAALIGAGGYGQPILVGIRLDRVDVILEGAVPAAALAIAVQGMFDLSERLFVSRGLRLGKEDRS